MLILLVTKQLNATQEHSLGLPLRHFGKLSAPLAQGLP